jgi:acyl carrier protein
MSAVISTTLERVTSIVSEQLNIDQRDIKAEDRLEDLGTDSLDKIEIIMAAEEDFEFDFDDDRLDDIITVQDLIAAIETALREK